jgi:hypothetical protein
MWRLIIDMDFTKGKFQNIGIVVACDSRSRIKASNGKWESPMKGIGTPSRGDCKSIPAVAGTPRGFKWEGFFVSC